MKKILRAVSSGAAIFAQCLLGAVLLPAAYIASSQVSAANPAFMIVLFVPMFAALAFGSTFVHELGHAIAAVRCRWIVDRFVVWPLAYVPRKKRWSVDYRRPGGRDLLGWVEVRPVGSGGSRWEETWVLAGGGIANLLAAAVCLVLAELVPVNPVNDLLHCFALFSVVDAAVNLMPWRVRSRRTDGLEIWRMWQRPKRRAKAPVKGKGSQWNVPRKW